jgi:hypothetical protein
MYNANHVLMYHNTLKLLFALQDEAGTTIMQSNQGFPPIQKTL